MIKSLAKIICSGFGLGYSKKAPGTVGSIGLWLLYFPLISSPIYLKLALAIAIILIGLVAIRIAVGEQDDPQWVVVDEFAGVSICLILGNTLFTWILALILFRIFDISKILGIKKVENLRNPYGIMFDDVLAGCYGLLIIFIFKCAI